MRGVIAAAHIPGAGDFGDARPWTSYRATNWIGIEQTQGQEGWIAYGGTNPGRLSQ